MIYIFFELVELTLLILPHLLPVLLGFAIPIFIFMFSFEIYILNHDIKDWGDSDVIDRT